MAPKGQILPIRETRRWRILWMEDDYLELTRAFFQKTLDDASDYDLCYCASLKDAFESRDVKFRNFAPDIVVLDIDMLKQSMCFSDRTFAFTNPWDEGAPGFPCRFWEQQESILSNIQCDDPLVAEAKQECHEAAFHVRAFWTAKFPELRDADRSTIYTGNPDLLQKYRSLIRRKELSVVVKEAAFYSPSPSHFLINGLVRAAQRAVDSDEVDSLLVQSLFELKGPWTVLISGKEHNVPFFLAPLSGSLDHQGRKITLDSADLSRSFLLAPFFLPWASRLKDQCRCEEAIEEIKKEFPRLFTGSLSRDFSLCFGIRGIMQITHPLGEDSAEVNPDWHLDGRLYEEISRQVSALDASLGGHIKLHPQLGSLLSNLLTQWAQFNGLAMSLRGNEYDNHQEYKPLSTPRENQFKCKPEKLIRKLESLNERADPGSKVEVISGGSFGNHGFEMYLPVQDLFEGAFKRLLESVRTKANEGRIYLWHGAVGVHTRWPEGFPETLYDNYLIFGHKGSPFVKGFAPNEPTKCARLLWNALLHLYGNYRVVSRSNGDWKVKDFTFDSDKRPSEPRPFGNARVRPEIEKFISKESRPVGKAADCTTFHIFSFPAWRSGKCES